MGESVSDVIVLDHVSKRYGDFVAVHDANFSIATGEFFAMLGPSGCGKTTTLKMIAGFEQPTAGRVMLDGVDVSDVPPYKRNVNTVFQQYALFPHLSALENVRIALHNNGESRAEQIQCAHDWLAQLNIAELANRLPRQISGGQQQRVALARALARSPKILLLDEPFSAIDIPTRQTLYQTLAELRKRLHIPIILVTHDLREAHLLADRITVIDQGVGLQTANANDLFAKPRNARVAQLVGIPNLFQGVFNAGRLQWGSSPWAFQITDKGKIPPQSQVAWVIPQAGLSVHSTSQDGRIPCRVKHISALGQIAVIEFVIEAIAETLTWEASAAEVRRLGLEQAALVYLEFNCDLIHIMPLRPINDPRRFMSAADAAP